MGMLAAQIAERRAELAFLRSTWPRGLTQRIGAASEMTVPTAATLADSPSPDVAVAAADSATDVVTAEGPEAGSVGVAPARVETMAAAGATKVARRKRGSQAIDRDANGRHGAVSVSLSFGVVSGRSELCCGTSSVFLSALGNFPRAGRLRARPRNFMRRIYHTCNSE